MGVPDVLLVNQGTLTLVGIALVGVAIPQGLTYGPQSALYAEMFPAQIRLSGASLAYAIGAILGGAFADDRRVPQPADRHRRLGGVLPSVPRR